jgi:hypothetical protein
LAKDGDRQRMALRPCDFFYHEPKGVSSFALICRLALFFSENMVCFCQTGGDSSRKQGVFAVKNSANRQINQHASAALPSSVSNS